MRKTLALTLVSSLYGCEPAQDPTPKIEPSIEPAAKDAADHVWHGHVQALDKARAAAEQARQTPAHSGEAP